MFKYNWLKNTSARRSARIWIYWQLISLKFRNIVGKTNFSKQFRKIVIRYKKIGYNVDILGQTACVFVNPITIDNFVYPINYMTEGRSSD